jgi:hypothetical protein
MTTSFFFFGDNLDLTQPTLDHSFQDLLPQQTYFSSIFAHFSQIIFLVGVSFAD